MTKKTKLGWWVCGPDGMTNHMLNDMLSKAVKGRKHVFKGKPVICKAGFHATLKFGKISHYSKGSVLWRVLLSGEFGDEDNGKTVATERTYLWKVTYRQLFDLAVDVILEEKSFEAKKLVMDAKKSVREAKTCCDDGKRFPDYRAYLRKGHLSGHYAYLPPRTSQPSCTHFDCLVDTFISAQEGCTHQKRAENAEKMLCAKFGMKKG